MTDWERPGEGSSEPLIDDDEQSSAAESDEVARTGARARPSNMVLLLGGILVLVVAQAVLSWLSFDVTRQLRDQSAIANGLQRCLIQAQLSANTTTDPSGSAYKAAVQSCLNK